jgi:hypothetical protein
MTPIKATVVAAMAAMGFILSTAKKPSPKKLTLTIRTKTIAVPIAKFLLLTSITPSTLMYIDGFDLMLSFGTGCSVSRQQNWLIYFIRKL